MLIAYTNEQVFTSDRLSLKEKCDFLKQTSFL